MVEHERTAETADTSDASQRGAALAQPGAVLVWTKGGPSLLAAHLGPEGLVLGRSSFGGALEGDDRVSRNHVRLRWSAGAFVVEDAGSRNGTRLRGARAASAQVASHGDIVRFGRALVILVADVRPFERATPPAAGRKSTEPVVGPTLRGAHDAIVMAARDHDAILLRGESGAGKELAASEFHRATKARGQLVAVNCAAIPAGLAERLLFGARKGAYSGADSDSEGYVQAAEGGTLFLDEIAELDAAVQAKLLRVIETREVFPLGASKPKKVELRFCFATHRDLRMEVGAGAFRQDLYYRIARPEVSIPALRDRLEDIPWLVERGRGDLPAHTSLVEACMLRAWPGNVRELLAEVKQAALRARSTAAREVTDRHLASEAGVALGKPKSPSRPPSNAAIADDARFARALADAEGNVTRAAKALGMHRTQLRRWVQRQKRG